jgi:hypothetical protein
MVSRVCGVVIGRRQRQRQKQWKLLILELLRNSAALYQKGYQSCIGNSGNSGKDSRSRGLP